MELEEDSTSTDYNDEDVQIMHGEVTCSMVNSRIQLLRAKCLLLESAIQQKSNSSGRNEYAEKVCASDELWGVKGVQKKIAKAPRQVKFDLNNVKIHRYYSSHPTLWPRDTSVRIPETSTSNAMAPNLGNKHMENIGSSPSRQMTAEGGLNSPGDHFDALGERICSTGKNLVSRDNIISARASRDCIASNVEQSSVVGVAQAIGDPVFLSETSFRDERARQDGTRGKIKTKRDLKGPTTNNIVGDATDVGREAPSAATSRLSGQPVLNLSRQSDGSRFMTSQHICTRIKGSVSRVDAAHSSIGETPTSQPTNSISVHNTRSDEFIRAEVQSMTIEVDNVLEHMRDQNDIEAPSSQARRGTALTRTVSQGVTRSTRSHHSSVDLRCLSCHREARPVLSLSHGRSGEFLCEYCGEQNTIYDSNSTQHTNRTSATHSMSHIIHTCTDCRHMLSVSTSSLHVNSYGQRWCCDCITQHNADVPCKHKAWLYLNGPCLGGYLLGWHCRCTRCRWLKYLVSQP
jgi:hypothetical protein